MRTSGFQGAFPKYRAKIGQDGRMCPASSRYQQACGFIKDDLCHHRISGSVISKIVIVISSASLLLPDTCCTALCDDNTVDYKPRNIPFAVIVS